MKYHYLGNSGLLVSTFSFGSMTFDDELGFEKAYEVMARAYKNGINFFGSAEGYAQGQSEAMLNGVVKAGIDRGEWNREDLVVSTNIFWGTKNLFQGEFSPNDIGLSRKHTI